MNNLLILFFLLLLVVKVLAEGETPGKGAEGKRPLEKPVVVGSIANDPSNCHTAFILRLDTDDKLSIELLKKKNAESWQAIRAQVLKSERRYQKDLSGLASRSWLVCVFEDVICDLPTDVWHSFQITGCYVLTPDRGSVSLKELFPNPDTPGPQKNIAPQPIDKGSSAGKVESSSNRVRGQ